MRTIYFAIFFGLTFAAVALAVPPSTVMLGDPATIDPGAVAGAALNAGFAHQWPLMASALLGLLSYVARAYSDKFTFLHTPVGAGVLVVGGAIVGALIPLLNTGAVQWQQLVTCGMVAAVTSLCGLLKPVGKDPPATIPLSNVVTEPPGGAK
jgi:hypothetical protein